MEKQQEILFSIVTENKNRAMSYPPYQQPAMPINTIISHMEPLMKSGLEARLSSPTSSAFKPSVIAADKHGGICSGFTSLVSNMKGTSSVAPSLNESQNGMTPMQMFQKLNCIIRNMQ